MTCTETDGFKGSYLTQMSTEPVLIMTVGRTSETGNKLLQDNAYVREGKQRIRTPDKHAIMSLSRSFVKRRLGKQQQLLHDITHRCREQEVADLSISITKKVKLADVQPKEGGTSPRVTGKSEATTPVTISVPSMQGSSGGNNNNNKTIPALELETSHSLVGPSSVFSSESESGSGSGLFPQRKVLKSPRKEGGQMSSLPRLSISYRKGVPPSDHYYHRAVVLNGQQINGQIQLHHYIQPKMDQLAPLVLPSIQYIGLDNNNISTYMQAKRLNISVAPRPGTNRAAIKISARTISQ